jgi:histidyl-tRNA synthetase
LGDAAKLAAFDLQQQLRNGGLYTEIDLMQRSMKGQMKYANKIHAAYTIIIGEDELARGEAQVRNMETKEQQSIPLTQVVAYMETQQKG